MDYSKYSLAELQDANNNIDGEKYPENFQKLQNEINSRGDEIDSRKSQIIALEAINTKALIISTNDRIKALAWLQLLTAIGFIYLFITVFRQSELLLLSIITGVIIFNGSASYLLFKKNNIGLVLSFVNQILQVITINTGTLYYTYAGLGSFLIGIEDGIFFNFSLLSPSFAFYMGENLGKFGIGVDLVAIFFMYVINSCSEFNLFSKHIEEQGSTHEQTD